MSVGILSKKNSIQLGLIIKVHLSNLEHGIKDIMKELTSTNERVNIILIGGDGSMTSGKRYCEL